jgi:hypothetical protein
LATDKKDRVVVIAYENKEEVVRFISFANGDAYTGDWVDLTPHGYGMLKKSDGTTLEGKFENGEYVGPAE